LEHRGLGAGAKLCYIRLLGFTGKDARCYPSLEKLGTSLGVSERQARDYVKELERSGLIVIEQRGLRKTNVYLFVWTVELERLVSSVPEDPDDPNDQDDGTSQNTSADRNDCSGQDRNSASTPDRNSCSAQDRNTTSGPIGINSPGISSGESSSSSSIENAGAEPMMTTTPNRESGCTNLPIDAGGKEANRTAQMILDWARDRRLLRLRSDRRTGSPEKEHLALWSEILDGRGIAEENQVFAVMDRARQQADQADPWRDWSFLTLQVQIAGERMTVSEPVAPKEFSTSRISADEDPTSDWAKFKAKIRTEVGEIPFTNWFGS